MKLFNEHPKAKQRRRNVIARLELQLVEKTKDNKEMGRDKTDQIPLTEDDIKRIKQELSTLKTRI